jgi:hypothetical protein
MKEVIERCLASSLNLYQYFILNSLYNEEGEKIVQYCISVEKILTKDFIYLIDKGYLEEVKDRKLIEINDLILTDKFASEILKISNTKNITFDVAFNQLREHFPSKAGNSERRLQGDVERCKRLYQNTIVKNGKIDIELHSVILQCINYEIKMKTKSRSLEYFKLLATWLSKEEWRLYYDDVIEIIKKDGAVGKKGDDYQEDRL